MFLQMNRVNTVQLAHQVHPVPRYAKPATRANSTTTTVVLVAIVSKKHFKIKVPVHRAKAAPPDGNNPTKVPPLALVSIGNQPTVAKTPNI